MHSVVVLCVSNLVVFVYSSTHIQGPAVKDISTIVYSLNALIFILGEMFIFYLLLISVESDPFKMFNTICFLSLYMKFLLVYLFFGSLLSR